MKTKTLIAGLAIAALNGLTLVPDLQGNGAYFLAGSIAIALWLAAKAAMMPAAEAAVAAEPTPSPAPAARVAEARPEPLHLTEADAVGLLGVFQAKGRWIDFLMDDIAAYSDAQVGAAARVVHQGCKAALQEHFDIEPVAAAPEGTRITVPAEAAPDEYRLVGKVAGEPPHSGTLTHKGWKATRVKLPRSLASAAKRLPPIAPAQVEIR